MDSSKLLGLSPSCSESCRLRNCLVTKQLQNILRRKLQSGIRWLPRWFSHTKREPSTAPTCLRISTVATCWPTSILGPKWLLKLHCYLACRTNESKWLLWRGSWRHSCDRDCKTASKLWIQRIPVLPTLGGSYWAKIHPITSKLHCCELLSSADRATPMCLPAVILPTVLGPVICKKILCNWFNWRGAGRSATRNNWCESWRWKEARGRTQNWRWQMIDLVLSHIVNLN